MKALVVGGGSIGARHLHNLQAVDGIALALVEPNDQRRLSVCGERDVNGFATFEQGLDWEPDLVVVATPSHMHVAQALLAARRGCHLFIEKPLGHDIDGLPELVVEVQRRGTISLVGCNMRFHPGPATVKRLLEQQVIGRVLFARIHAGSYLPGWRPTQDYRHSYSAQAAQGGGCILDYIHEIDLARWYLGAVQEVFCVAEHVSDLEIDVEDTALLVCRHSSGQRSDIHLDYVQRSYERGCQIVGDKGSIFWDYRGGIVRWFNAAENHWTELAQPSDWQVNQMYVDELQHLLTCLRTETPTMLPIAEAAEVLQIAFAAKASARSGTFVATESVC